MQTDTVSFLKS